MVRKPRRVRIWLLAIVVGLPVNLDAEILIRWDQDDVLPRETFGISTLVVPYANKAALDSAITRGYRVYLEVEASALATFMLPAERLAGIVVKGRPTAAELAELAQRLKPSGARILRVDERAKWPHIRTNWVTKRGDVLQVANRSAQPWLDHNGALVRMAVAAPPAAPPVFGYAWTPLTPSTIDQAPALENYLVAIAEAGSLGADLLLPLHERFQKDLQLGKPMARSWWADIRRHLDFYSWDLPGRYRPIAPTAVVTPDPMKAYEVLNLLGRHNVPFIAIEPKRLEAGSLAEFRLLILLEPPPASQRERLAAFARTGGRIVIVGGAGGTSWPADSAPVKTADRLTYQLGEGRIVETASAVTDPNRFALQMRQLAGEDRVVDIWNGITVLTTPYQEPSGPSVLVTAVNYAHQTMPLQMRVRGTFSQVHYETPEEGLTLLPFRQRDGHTEFVIPGLRVGARVFLQ